jgi:hypothetical protein
MTRTTLPLMLAALIAAGAADAQTDALRCEARQMRAEIQYYRCLSRCDQRADRQAARPAAQRSEATQADCEATCAARQDDHLARISGSPPCAAPELVPPNPQECEARVLRLLASDLRCQARCTSDRRREGFDRAACLTACRTRCGTAYDEVAARAVCASGRIGGGEVCVTH